MAWFSHAVQGTAGTEPKVFFLHGVTNGITAHGNFILLDKLRIPKNFFRCFLTRQGFPFRAVRCPYGFIGENHFGHSGGVGEGFRFRHRDRGFLSELCVPRGTQIQIIKQHRLANGTACRVKQVQANLHGLNSLFGNASKL